MAKLNKYERERAAAKTRVKAKKLAVKRAHDAIEDLWKESLEARYPDGKKLFTDAEHEAIADASYALRGVLGGWINNRRR